MEIGAAVRRRRTTGWWEPTYNPELVGKMHKGEWSFANDRGPFQRIFFGDDLTAYIDESNSRVIRGIAFQSCDFQGFFRSESQIVFDDCKFSDCDLALTTWVNVKFSRCYFDKSSFGMTTFNGCEFRDCKWSELGLSPNETTLNQTLISNPSEFIKSASTNLDEDVLKKYKARKLNQICKLETTKATVARQILKSFEKSGDERAYYNAVKTFELQQARGRIYESVRISTDVKSTPWKRLISAGALPFWSLEFVILMSVGWITGWGASILRPIIFSVATWGIFGELYKYWPDTSIKTFPFQRATDISLLAGYTNYHAETNALAVSIQNAHLAISCFLYAVTFATLLSRFSRVR